MEKKRIDIREILIIMILSLSFVLATHVVTTSSGGVSYNLEEDVQFVYNITINNTDVDGNITQVNITLPITLTFIENSNGSDNVAHSFSNTSTILTWEGYGLVMNQSTNQSFWFNATASTPGIYNITITTVNATRAISTNISLIINDTTSPSTVSFVSPSDSTNVSRENIIINASVIDNGVVDTINISVYNSTGVIVNSTTSTSPETSLYANFTGLIEGTYTINISANDTYGNINYSSTISIMVDTTNPIITLISPANAVSATTSAYNFTFNVTDANTIASCDLIFDGAIINTLSNINNTGGTNGMYNSSLSIASHTWSINCTDTANVANSSSRTLIVTNGTSTTSTSSSSSGEGPTLRPDQDKLNQGYTVSLSKNWNVQFKIKDEIHNLKVGEITSTKATIIVSSNSQEAELSIGEEMKFDVTEDNIYDLDVMLVSIENYKANLIIKTISEDIPQEILDQQAEESTTDSKEDKEKNLIWLWVLIGIIIVLILAGAGYKFKDKFY